MQITKIGVTPKFSFGMAKSEEYEHPKYQNHIYAENSEPGSRDWFKYKLIMRDIIDEQLRYEPDLTYSERCSLEKDKYLLEADMIKKVLEIYG